MRERPLLYSAPMVRATLDDLKTMTRRGITRLAGFGQITEFQPSDTHGYAWTFRDRRARWNDISHQRLLECCPYGKPGDRLWVREHWATDMHHDGIPPREVPPAFAVRYLADSFVRAGLGQADGKDRRAFHMPRWASRITLEITGVRAERLQDICEADAIDEGIEADTLPGDAVTLWRNYQTGGTTVCPTFSFQSLWMSINGPDSWAANPWVWVIEFRRIKP